MVNHLARATAVTRRASGGETVSARLPSRATAQAAGRPVNRICLMSKPDELLVAIAALVESGQSNQMSLTVVAGGSVITGRLAPEAV